MSFTLSDFLRKKAPDDAIPKLRGKAIVHGHCHQKALDALNDKEFGKLFAEKEIFEKIGLDHSYADAGGRSSRRSYPWTADRAKRFAPGITSAR